MMKRTIREWEYNAAKKIVDDYNEQLKNATFKTSDLSLNQKVRSTELSFDLWVSEIKGNDILLRTTENENDALYDDVWTNISSIIQVNK